MMAGIRAAGRDGRERSFRRASQGMAKPGTCDGVSEKSRLRAPSRSVVAPASRTQTPDRKGAPGDALPRPGMRVRRAAHRCAARGSAATAAIVDATASPTPVASIDLTQLSWLRSLIRGQRTISCAYGHAWGASAMMKVRLLKDGQVVESFHARWTIDIADIAGSADEL